MLAQFGCVSGLMVKADELDAFDADCVAWNPAYRGGSQALEVRKRIKELGVTTEDLSEATHDGLAATYESTVGKHFPGLEPDDWLLVCRLRPAGTSRDTSQGER